MKEEEKKARALAAQSSQSVKANVEVPRSGNGQLPKKKRKFPFRKTVDLEADIARSEAEKNRLEALLADPDTYRDETKARQVRDHFESVETTLATLYEHWEESMELNS